jgi:hypothetical protein
MTNEPLGLPTGSVRALLTLLLVGAAVITACCGRAVPEWIIAAASTALGYYTGRRAGEPDA